MFFVRVLLLAIICSALQVFFPWWSMAIGAFVLGVLFGQNGLQSFLIGLLGVGIAWFAYAFFLDFTNQSILSEKIATLFTLDGLSEQSGIAGSLLVLIVTALLGGLVAGLSTLSGSSLRSMFKTKT